MRQAAPDRILDLAAVLQHAFYGDGLSLSDPATYRAVADSAGLDSEAVLDAFTAPGPTVAAKDDFTRAAGLGVDSFPTLLAVEGDRTTPLAVGHATADQIDQRLHTLWAAS
ncbi:protein-disulfide isomerase-like protein with CxxC motif [Streptomyces sp. LBL]|nr:protein-disulfide isomerase-like protein with CxxC motif [Streptomyces sp. LBL]